MLCCWLTCAARSWSSLRTSVSTLTFSITAGLPEAMALISAYVRVLASRSSAARTDVCPLITCCVFRLAARHPGPRHVHLPAEGRRFQSIPRGHLAHRPADGRAPSLVRTRTRRPEVALRRIRAGRYSPPAALGLVWASAQYLPPLRRRTRHPHHAGPHVDADSDPGGFLARSQDVAARPRQPEIPPSRRDRRCPGDHGGRLRGIEFGRQRSAHHVPGGGGLRVSGLGEGTWWGMVAIRA